MRTTLLLNASFETLCVISARRALVLVLADKADVIAESDDEVRSARLTLAAPSVIRLRDKYRAQAKERIAAQGEKLKAELNARLDELKKDYDTLDERSLGYRAELTRLVGAREKVHRTPKFTVTRSIRR